MQASLGLKHEEHFREAYQPVRDPLALGFACHFRLGLFAPASDVRGGGKP